MVCLRIEAARGRGGGGIFVRESKGDNEWWWTEKAHFDGSGKYDGGFGKEK